MPTGQAVNSISKYSTNLISQLHRERNQGRLWNVIKHRKPSQQPQDNIDIQKLVNFLTRSLVTVQVNQLVYMMLTRKCPESIKFWLSSL